MSQSATTVEVASMVDHHVDRPIAFAPVNETMQCVAELRAQECAAIVTSRLDVGYQRGKLRLKRAAREDLRDDLAALAVATPLIVERAATSGDDVQHARARYDAMKKSVLIHELLQHQSWLIPLAERRWRRLELLAGLAARDQRGAPLFEDAAAVARQPESVRKMLVLGFLATEAGR